MVVIVNNVNYYIKGDDFVDKEQLHREIVQKLIYPRKLPFTVFLEELSGGEFMLIASFLAYEKECGNHITVNELASRLEVTVPNVSRSLKKLEDRGLIKRVSGEECKRNTFVVISPKGKELFEKNKEVIEYMIEKLLTSLSVQEVEAAIAFSQKIYSLVEDECKKLLTEKSEQAQ